jgi:dihydrolipoamide dehydrogenase
MTSSAVESVDTAGEGCKVKVKTAKGEEILECDIVLSAAGVVANIEKYRIRKQLVLKTDKGKNCCR